MAAAASGQTEYDSYKIWPFEVPTCRWFDVNESLDHLSFRTFKVPGTKYAYYVLWSVVSALVKCLLCCWRSWACAELKASHSAGHISDVSSLALCCGDRWWQWRATGSLTFECFSKWGSDRFSKPSGTREPLMACWPTQAIIWEILMKEPAWSHVTGDNDVLNRKKKQQQHKSCFVDVLAVEW